MWIKAKERCQTGHGQMTQRAGHFALISNAGLAVSIRSALALIRQNRSTIHYRSVGAPVLAVGGERMDRLAVRSVLSGLLDRLFRALDQNLGSDQLVQQGK